jgi:hypothetical protein
VESPLGLADMDVAGMGSEALTLSIHGAGVMLENGVPSLGRSIERLLGAFRMPLPPATQSIFGIVRDYHPDEIASCLSPTATRVDLPRTDLDPLEVFEEGDRFWAVDERWGMSFIDFAEGTFRSWVLPERRIGALRCAEAAALWPAAQLLRAQGIHLIPAASAVRDGWAVLILSQTALEPELRGLLDGGYRLIGQRWTALREEEDRLALMHVPGWVERPMTQHLRIAGGADDSSHDFAGCCDLTGEYRKGTQLHAFCDAVLVAGGDRNAGSLMRELSGFHAADVLKNAWPITELAQAFRDAPIAARLASDCRIAQANLMRDPRGILGLLQALRSGPMGLAQIAA